MEYPASQKSGRKDYPIKRVVEYPSYSKDWKNTPASQKCGRIPQLVKRVEEYLIKRGEEYPSYSKEWKNTPGEQKSGRITESQKSREIPRENQKSGWILSPKGVSQKSRSTNYIYI